MVVCDWGGWNDLDTFLDHYRGTHTSEAQRRERQKVVARLARESDSMNPGVWDSEQADAARDVLQRSRESIGRNR